MGCGDHASPEWHGGLAADPRKAFALDQPEKLCLQRCWHVADFVEKERAAA